jgi:hypothetical protein
VYIQLLPLSQLTGASLESNLAALGEFDADPIIIDFEASFTAIQETNAYLCGLSINRVFDELLDEGV